MKAIHRICVYIIELGLTPALFLISLFCRLGRKGTDVGLGPEPLINNIYHKRSLELYGYTAETFVNNVYFIIDEFDVRGDKILPLLFPRMLRRFIVHLYLFIRSLLRYKCLYIYFNGGTLSMGTLFLWRIEPILYKLANVKVVVMPYGGDVQDMSRSPNLVFKNAMAGDYPKHRIRRSRIADKIDLWTKFADHIIGGCEWVDYMYHWDTLMLAHFSIDVDTWKPVGMNNDELYPAGNTKVRILHAPNHRAIKGTQYFIDAVNELIEEGLDVELVLLERVPNDEVKRVMASVDIVADQLIVGWYAMFAIEAMAMGKPVLCFLREDLLSLYAISGLIKPDEIPIINCGPFTVKDTLRYFLSHRDELASIGRRSREFVLKHHSLEIVGEVFHRINTTIGILPSDYPEEGLTK